MRSSCAAKKDIDFKAGQLGECLEEASNLVLSAGLSAAEEAKKGRICGFAALGQESSRIAYRQQQGISCQEGQYQAPYNG